MNQLEANPQVTPVGQPFVVSQTVQPGIFWRRTCKCLGSLPVVWFTQQCVPLTIRAC